MVNRILSKVYDYADENGNLLYQVVRFEPKDFSQRRPYNGGYVWGLSAGLYEKSSQNNDYYKVKVEPSPDSPLPPNILRFEAIKPVLYNLPLILETIGMEKIIFICEGEKDSDSLSTLGLVATTCPMGANKWNPEYTETMRGCCRAIIVADKDEPGRAHAQSVARELYSAGIPVNVLEMPDIEGIVIHDVSDWINAGGTAEEIWELIKLCPEWAPPQEEEIIKKYGKPYYRSNDGIVKGVNQAFWAGLHQAENIQLYEPDEQVFYRYNEENGLYGIITEDIIKQEISSRILEISRQPGLASLERHRSNSVLTSIVTQLKGISEKKNAFKRGHKYVHLANGVIIFTDKSECDLATFSPDYYSRNQCPILFNRSATCERFLNELVYPSVAPDDVVLLQKYTGLCLLGNNLIQKLLILDGEPGRGKSTLALIVQSLVGQENVTQLRTNCLSSRFELFRYLKKSLIVGVDVQGDFLSNKSASVIKGLVGGDSYDAEQKGGTGSFQFQGNFCIMITSNSRLQVHLEGDTGAWKRRLLIIRFEGPAPVKKIPEFRDLLIREEGSGILNWALEGLGMLLKDIEAYGEIQLTGSQVSVVDSLLAESDSLKHYLLDKVARDESCYLTTAEIMKAYAEYCLFKGWNAKPIFVIQKELDSLMLELFRTVKSHSVKAGDKDAKGYRHVTFKTE